MAAIMLQDPGDDSTRRQVAQVLRRLAADRRNGIERILTGAEARAAGGFPDAAFVVATAPNVRLGGSVDKVSRRAPACGTHGMLPSNPDMDAAFFVAGPGIRAARDLGRVDMRDIAPTLAAQLGISLPLAEGRDLLH